MKFFLQKLFTFFIIALFLFSCYSPRYVYSPSAQNVPLLNKKNDAELSASYSGTLNIFNKKGDNSYGFDLQSAWAFSGHFAAMVNGTLQRENNDANDTYFYGDTSSLAYKINAFEIAVGYFSSSYKNKKMLFQSFAGAGFGTLHINDAYTSSGNEINKFYNSRVAKIFVQPSVIYNPSKYFSTALSSRFTAVFFNHIKTNYTKQEQENYILDSVSEAPVFFWEPAVTYIFSLKNFPLKFRLQAGLAVLLNHRFVEHKSGNFSFGVVADFNKKRKSVIHLKRTSL